MNNNELLTFYQNMLNSETSPAQLKYVLNEIMKKNIDIDVKNNMLAFYLNHVQYYMSTYANFISMYATIMLNNRTTVNYEDPSVVNVINDQVLKTVLQEVYASDMAIVMPPAMSGSSPYIVIDYAKIKEEYSSVMNDATKNYISFKEIVQNGDLSNSDGSYNMDKLGDYMILANNFVNAYGNYPLLSDVIYSYILATKMYMGTYGISEDFSITATNLMKYKAFLEKYPDTPAAKYIKEMIEIADKGEKITVTKANEWNNALDSLISQ
jgi:hypothetical protein